MKKFLSYVLILLMNFIMITPAFAELDEYSEQSSPVFSTAIEEETISLSPKSAFVLELESDMDINESNTNDEIFFRLVSKVQASNGMFLPEDTRFVGKFQKIKKVSRCSKEQELTL